MSVEVRRLRADEMTLAQPLLAPEGWSLEAADLARLHRLGGAVGAFEHGALAGFLTFVDAPPYRWVGNVAVAPTLRGRGIGARMVEEAIRDAERAALYSVEKAVTLYARAGFAPQGSVSVVRATQARPGDGRASPLAAHDVADALALDREALGMDRSALLRALFADHPAFALRHDGSLAGFAVAKAYADVTEIGPVVARTRADAWALVDEALRETRGPHELALHRPGPEPAARGFVPAFRAIPMFRGGAPTWDLERYHAAAGLEKG